MVGNEELGEYFIRSPTREHIFSLTRLRSTLIEKNPSIRWETNSFTQIFVYTKDSVLLRPDIKLVDFDEASSIFFTEMIKQMLEHLTNEPSNCKELLQNLVFLKFDFNTEFIH